MNPARNRRDVIRNLAMQSCSASGKDPFEIVGGKPLFESDEAKERARLALDILSGVGRPAFIKENV